MSAPTAIVLQTGILKRALVACAIALGLLGFVAEVSDHVFDEPKLGGLIPLINLAYEGNIPNWYSATLLIACAALLAAIASRTAAGEGYRVHWAVLAVIFLYLSMDETASIHELLNRPLRRAFDLGGVLYYGWVIPASAVVAVLAVTYYRFLLALSPRFRVLFVLAAAIYVGGALGTEFAVNYWVAKYDTDPGYGMLNIVQEVMEVTGLSVFFVSLLLFIRENLGEIRIVIR